MWRRCWKDTVRPVGGWRRRSPRPGWSCERGQLVERRGGAAMSENPIAEVSGFGVALDRAYDPGGHFWVSASGSVARVGMDALGVETSGTIAQLAFVPVGENLKRGE